MRTSKRKVYRTENNSRSKEAGNSDSLTAVETGGSYAAVPATGITAALRLPNNIQHLPKLKSYSVLHLYRSFHTTAALSLFFLITSSLLSNSSTIFSCRCINCSRTFSCFSCFFLYPSSKIK